MVEEGTADISKAVTTQNLTRIQTIQDPIFHILERICPHAQVALDGILGKMWDTTHFKRVSVLSLHVPTYIAEVGDISNSNNGTPNDERRAKAHEISTFSYRGLPN